MCKGQRGDRGGPATPGKGGPTGPGDFGREKGPGGAGAAPHPGGLTRIVQPRESSRECRGEGGSPEGGAAQSGEVGTSYAQRRTVSPPHWGEDERALPTWGGGRALVHGCPCLVLASTRGLVGAHLSPNPPITHLGMTRWARAWRGWGGVTGPPTPLCKSAEGSFPLCITRNEP